MTGDPLLTVQEVAGRLTVSAKTVRSLIERGDLGGYKVGGRFRIEPADLEDFVKRSQILPRQETAPAKPAQGRGAGSLRAILEVERTMERSGSTRRRTAGTAPGRQRRR